MVFMFAAALVTIGDIQLMEALAEVSRIILRGVIATVVIWWGQKRGRLATDAMLDTVQRGKRAHQQSGWPPIKLRDREEKRPGEQFLWP